MATPPRILPADPPYVGPVAHSSGDGNKPIRLLVIHMTVSPCVPGQARAVAAYFRTAAAGGSAHRVIDPDEAVAAAYDSVVCWHAPPNPHSLGYELCGYPDQNRVVALARWATPSYRRTLARAARMVARDALAYGIPIKFLGVEQLLAGEHGITTHANVSGAWHESTHWDPGQWPRRRFMRLVRAHATKLEKGTVQ